MEAKARLTEEKAATRPRQHDLPDYRQPKPVQYLDQKSTQSGLPGNNVTMSLSSSTHSPATKKKVKKGALSMFLSGALEAPPKIIVARAEVPAWGGAQAPRSQDSLRDIQTKQTEAGHSSVHDATALSAAHGGPVDRGLPSLVSGGGKRVQWASFIRASDPIAVVPATVPDKAVMENSPPAWSAASPGVSVRPLRDIQVEQVSLSTYS